MKWITYEVYDVPHYDWVTTVKTFILIHSTEV